MALLYNLWLSAICVCVCASLGVSTRLPERSRWCGLVLEIVSSGAKSPKCKPGAQPQLKMYKDHMWLAFNQIFGMSHAACNHADVLGTCCITVLSSRVSHAKLGY